MSDRAIIDRLMNELMEITPAYGDDPIMNLALNYRVGVVPEFLPVMDEETLTSMLQEALTRRIGERRAELR